jgi:hypothetical protein
LPRPRNPEPGDPNFKMWLTRKMARNPAFGVETRRYNRAVRELCARALANNGYIRNSPLEQSEVVIKDFQICTLPVSAVQLDAGGWPTLIGHLVDDLFAELTAQWKAFLKDKTEITEEDCTSFKDNPELMVPAKRMAYEGILCRKPWMPHVVGDMPKRCKACGGWFFVVLGTRAGRRIRYCSDSCIGLGKQATIKNYVSRRSEARAQGRNRCCVQCGERMTAVRASKKYCSDRCRVAALRAWKK